MVGLKSATLLTCARLDESLFSMTWCDTRVAEVCEAAPVAVGGWVLTDGHDLAFIHFIFWFGLLVTQTAV